MFQFKGSPNYDALTLHEQNYETNGNIEFL
jgi:hypothetical protein